MRILIGLATLLIAGAAVVSAMLLNLPGNWPDLLLNAGTEFFGIVFTVLIVEWLFERRDRKDEARRLATGFLNALDHHVWVWQGGARGFDLAETLALLRDVQDSDPLPRYTQNLFLVLGSNAADRARHSKDIVEVNPALKRGFAELAHLTRMRDTGTVLPCKEIATYLSQAAVELAKAAGLTVPDRSQLGGATYRDPSEEKQQWRHFGDRPSPTA